MMQREFFWEVYTSGYRWSDAEYHDVCGSAVSDDSFLRYDGFSARKSYPIKDVPTLFRMFAETDPTPDGILLFANSHGCLFGGRDFNPYDIEENELRHLVDTPGTPEFTSDEVRCRHNREEEPLSFWTGQIELMSASIEILDAEDGGATPDQYKRAYNVISQQLRSRVGIGFGIDPEDGQRRIRLFPHNLLGALWLQVADALEAGRRYRRCAACGTWFELTPDVNRTNKKFCKEACRSRGLRSRRKLATELAKKGTTPEEIAAQLGSDLKTVKGWLSAK